MNIASGIMVFLVMWWVVWFLVLPVGVHVDETPPKGFATSAPKNPNLKKKCLVTTALTAFLWGVVQFIMSCHWIKFS